MVNSYPEKRPFTEKVFVSRHADITVATASAYAAMVGQGEVVHVAVVIEGAISTADETLNLYKNGADTGIDIVVTQSGSAAGDVDSVDIRPGAVTVVKGDYLTLVSANASSGTVAAVVTYVVRES